MFRTSTNLQCNQTKNNNFQKTLDSKLKFVDAKKEGSIKKFPKFG